MSHWWDSSSDPLADITAARTAIESQTGLLRDLGPCQGCATAISRFFGKCPYCGHAKYVPKKGADDGPPS